MGNISPIPKFISECSEYLGCYKHSIHRLHGGINNIVYCCGNGEKKWVIKGYDHLPGSKHDKMKAEVGFLRYAQENLPGFTPRLEYVNDDNRYIVLEFIDGRRYEDGAMLGDSDIEYAVRFMKDLNKCRENARKDIEMRAADGFSRMTDHICDIDKRLILISELGLAGDLECRAKKAIQETKEELARIKEHTYSAIYNCEVMDKLPSELLCLSPSDFGFHNAIKTNNRVVFIDFEYAGWDDPAKTVLDFALQPRLKTSHSGLTLLNALPLDCIDVVRKRCRFLGPIILIKWVCIVLSVLNALKREQIMKKDPQLESNELIRNRLLTAEWILGNKTKFYNMLE